MPLVVATTTCSIFIASITSSRWPWRTRSPSRTSMAMIVPWIGARTATVPAGASTIGCRAPPDRPPETCRDAARPADRTRRLCAPASVRADGARRLEEELRMIVRRLGGELRDVLLDEARVVRVRRRSPDAAGGSAGVDAFVATPSMRNSQRARYARAAASGEVAGWRVHDHLRQQRVERRVRRVAGVGERSRRARPGRTAARTRRSCRLPASRCRRRPSSPC